MSPTKKTEAEPQFMKSNFYLLFFFLRGECFHCSREQWRLSLLFRPDQVQSKTKNTLNRVQPSKIKKIKLN